MDINRSTLADVYFGFKAAFARGLQSREQAQLWSLLATLVTSSTGKEVYPWLGQWPHMRKWLGDRAIKQLQAHKYEIVNEPYEATVAVDRDALEDDSFGVYSPMFEEMGIAASLWPNDVVFGLLRLGETALAYDNEPFFSETHEVAGESVSNLTDGSGVPPWYLIDGSRSLKPLIWQQRKKPNFVRKDRETDDNVFFKREFLYGTDGRGAAGFGLWQLAHKAKVELDEDSLAEARAAMAELTNDEGQSLGIQATHIIVPPELELTARRLLTAETNEYGATNVMRGVAEVVVTNYVREA